MSLEKMNRRAKVRDQDANLCNGVGGDGVQRHLENIRVIPFFIKISG